MVIKKIMAEIIIEKITLDDGSVNRILHLYKLSQERDLKNFLLRPYYFEIDENQIVRVKLASSNTSSSSSVRINVNI